MEVTALRYAHHDAHLAVLNYDSQGKAPSDFLVAIKAQRAGQ